MYLKFAARDTLVFLLVYALWQWLSPLSLQHGPLGDFVGLALGALVALTFHLAHEWGHLIGGLLGRSQMTAATDMRALSLFIFHSDGNSKKQFMLMSFLGFAATGVAVWFAYTQMPPDMFASRIARGFAIVQVMLALVLEVPLVVWALFGKSLPPIDKRKGMRTTRHAVAR